MILATQSKPAYPYPGFPEQAIAVCVNGPVGFNDMIERLGDGDDPDRVQAGLARMVDRGQLDYDREQKRFTLPENDRLLLDIATAGDGDSLDRHIAALENADRDRVLAEIAAAVHGEDPDGERWEPEFNG